MPADERVNIGALIEDLANNEELSIGDRLQMFIALIDPDPIMKQLAANGLSVKLGMTAPSPVDALAATMLRLGRPELFPRGSAADE